MNKSIALIGGGGFIGTNLTDFFIAQDYNVLVLGRNVIEDAPRLTHKIKRRLLDVNKTLKLIEALQEYENVVWLVNDLVPSASMDSLVDDFTFNITPLINFLESANRLPNLKRFVFLSSGGTIYGDSYNRTFLKEDHLKTPMSAYGLSKMVAENYIDFITKRSSFESVILRPSNVYGNHQNLKKPQGIVGFAFNALINNRTIDLYAEGQVIRDFIHVLDLAEAVKCCVEKKHEIANVNIYNTGSQAGYSIRDILDIIERIAGEKIQTVAKPARTFDCDFNVLDINKIQSELGWQPKIKIEDGLTNVWRWVQSEITRK